MGLLPGMACAHLQEMSDRDPLFSRIINLDLRGHGLSPWREPYRVQDYAADVIDFIRAKIGEPIILAGHSLGGLVGAYVAAQQPDMVCGLILEEPPLYTGQIRQSKKPPSILCFLLAGGMG